MLHSRIKIIMEYTKAVQRGRLNVVVRKTICRNFIHKNQWKRMKLHSYTGDKGVYGRQRYHFQKKVCRKDTPLLDECKIKEIKPFYSLCKKQILKSIDWVLLRVQVFTLVLFSKNHRSYTRGVRIKPRDNAWYSQSYPTTSCNDNRNVQRWFLQCKYHF